MTFRDPALDHEHELYPTPDPEPDDLTDVVIIEPGGAPRLVAGSNVDDDGTPHFLRITPDGDFCGGCEKAWPCDKRVGLEIVQSQLPDPALMDAIVDLLAQRQESPRR